MSISSLFDLFNQTALVVGASSGLGQRAAQILSEAGARVILASRDLTTLESMAHSLNNARAIAMDISDKASIRRAFAKLEEDQERINIAVCAAGISGYTPVFDTKQSDDWFEKVTQTNYLGSWHFIQSAANHMKTHQIAGSIIPISSISGTVKLRVGTAAYGASKAAVIQLTRILTEELAQQNIRINCIVPGLFHTALTDYKLNTPEMKQAMSGTIPLRFVADPAEIDATVLYFASNRASRYVTGSCLTIDGGESWVRHELVKVKHPSDKGSPE
jgi:NAD(P)-dependent dehydrogenase (short-subunit alcohol dehydrogenase family)